MSKNMEPIEQWRIEHVYSVDRKTNQPTEAVYIHSERCTGRCDYECGGTFHDVIPEGVHTALNVE